MFWLVIKMKSEIYISRACDKCCVDKHRTDRDHRTMELRRFKTRLSEYMSQDDQFWVQAFDKLEQVTAAVDSFKKSFNEMIIDKKLMYALNYDTEGKFYQLFKVANKEEYNRLSCQDAALIQNRIEKGRNPKQSQIKPIIKELLQQEVKILKRSIDDIVNGGEEKEVIRQRPRRDERNPRERQIERSERVDESRRRRDVRPQGEDKIRDNGLPTLKFSQVENLRTNFNIFVKVLKINKTFSIKIGDQFMKRVELEGGDQSGRGTFVVNNLKFVKPQTVLHISSANIFHFHGKRQIQQNPKGYLTQVNRQMDVPNTRNYQKQSGQSQNSQVSANRRQYQHNHRGATYRANRPRGGEDRRDNPHLRGREQDQEEPTDTSYPNRERNGGQMGYRRGNRNNRQERVERPARRENRAERGDRGDRDDRRERVDRGDREDRRDRVDREDRRERVDRGDRQDRRDRVDREDRRGEKDLQLDEDNQKEEQVDNSRRRKQNNMAKVEWKDQRRPQRKQSSSDNELDNQTKLKKGDLRVQQVLLSPKTNKKFTKIKDLDPGDENLNLMVQVIQISKDVEVSKNCVFCIIGDETGMVWAQLPQHHPDVKQNVVIYLQNVEAGVHQKQHKLIIQLTEDDSQIQRTQIRIPILNMDVDMSKQDWEAQEEDEDEDDDEEDDQQDEDVIPKKESPQKSPSKKDPSCIQDF